MKDQNLVPDIRKLIASLPGADMPPINLAVEAPCPLSAQQLTAAFIDSMIPPDSVRCVNRDAYEQLRFAKILMDRQGELLQVCWNMRERLELARDYISGAPAWQLLIDQLIAMTADLQKLADLIRALSEQEQKQAQELIQQMEQFPK